MALTKVTYTDLVTVIGAKNLNDIQDAIIALEEWQSEAGADIPQILADIAPSFSNSTSYSAGDCVIVLNKLYQFTAAHPAGNWTGTDATEVNVTSLLKEAVASLSGDVDDLKSAISENVNASSLWSSGSISPSTGTDYTYATALRSSYLAENVKTVRVDDGFKFSIRAYEKAPSLAYVGMWDGSAFVKQDSSVFFTTSVDLVELGNYSYRLVLMKANAGAISAEDYNTVSLTTYTDISLSAYGTPADAGTVGDKLTQLDGITSPLLTDGLVPISGDPWTYGKYLNANGGISNSNGMWLSGYIEIPTGTERVKLSYTNNTKAAEFRVQQFDEAKTNISGSYQRWNTTTQASVIIVDTAKYLLFSIGNWSTKYEMSELKNYFSLAFETAVSNLLGGSILNRCADQMANLTAGANKRARDANGVPRKNFSLLMVSDTHGDSTRTQNAVDLLNESELIDGAIHLGDAINSAYNTAEMSKIVSIINRANKPFLTVMGNHDGRQTATTNCTVEQAVSAFMGSTTLSGIYQARGYGYYDFDDYKIRVIILNNYDFPDDKNGNNWVYYGASKIYLQAQVDWFISTLANTPDDYGVIVASHYSEPTTLDQTLLSQHVGTAGVSDLSDTRGGVGQMGAPIISDIISAFVSKTTLAKSYAYATQGSVTGVTVSADFSARESSNFICHICGHTHCQAIGVITGHSGQLSYFNDTGCLTANDNVNNMWPTFASLVPRNADDSTQDLITVLCVDMDNKRVSFVRAGANRNMFGEDSSFISHSY